MDIEPSRVSMLTEKRMANAQPGSVSNTKLPLLGAGPAATGDGAVLWAIGFRPFFLLAALSAVLLVPFWLAVLLLGLTWPSPLPAPLWHAHEMLFGYTGAVIAGFLLTATQNWTGQVTARGGCSRARVSARARSCG